MERKIEWSEPQDPNDFSVPLRRVQAAKFLTTIPEGWETRPMSDGRIVAVHPDCQARLYDPITNAWSEFNGADFVRMDPQP